MVWPNKRVQELAKDFIPAADEAFTLLTGRGFESNLFRAAWSSSHFGGMGANSQGVYAIAPSGVLLASTFTVSPEAVIDVLQRGLNSWRQLRPEQRALGQLPPPEALARDRWERLYPESGLVLQAFYRDLPRQPGRDGPDAYREEFYRTAWNQDFVWFRKDEARALLPARPAKGAQHEVPEKLVRRLARLHLLDHVRSISTPFEEREIISARLTSQVTLHDGDLVVVRFDGDVHLSSHGDWAVSVEQETAGQVARDQRRGYRAGLLGWGTYSLARQCFVAFDLVAVGTRWGGSVYSARAGDLAANPMGVALTLAGDKPAHRVAPFFAFAYLQDWR